MSGFYKFNSTKSACISLGALLGVKDAQGLWQVDVIEL